ncbi:T9SS type A sorting domain-containing protein [Formosa sp. L2A11]|uniref:T9SS type A sorting domain-containing protein n=1 Tax=Formosa sp. L2A11 TaxID=2686363 RepID=UPI00131C08C7|nr:T9SS type A sorting domain-containing protein [Formosa sp. L2A11]
MYYKRIEHINYRDNTYVTVDNNLTVNGNIIVKTDGSFVQVNDDAIIGGNVLTDKSKIKVEKETSNLGSAEEYTYWSAPVFNETIGDGLAEANTSRTFWYNGQNYLDATREVANDNTTLDGQDDVDDNGDDWQYATTATVMAPGVGYAATQNSSGTFPGQFTYTFEGAFNNGIYNVPIYRNDSETNDNNWNLIGNPYPSALDADSFLAENTNITQTIGAIYLWSQTTAADKNSNGNQGYNYAQSDYAIINGTGQTMGGDGVMPTRHIPSGQGFFVSMDNAAASTVVSGDIKTTNVVFNNSMRVTGNNAKFSRTTTTDEANKLWVNLTTDNGVANQILVAYLDGASDSEDGTFYDIKRGTYEDVNAVIYSFIPTSPEAKYVIQAKHSSSLSLEEVIPFGFNTSIEEPTIYTFSIPQTEGAFMNGNAIYLNDKFLNVVQDISENNYAFTSDSGVFDDRFEIMFTPMTLSIDDAMLSSNDIRIIELKSGEVKIYTNKNVTITNVEISDMLGRRIYNLKGDSSSETYNLSRLSQAAYIAKVTLSNGQTISKKAVKKN